MPRTSKENTSKILQVFPLLKVLLAAHFLSGYEPRLHLRDLSLTFAVTIITSTELLPIKLFEESGTVDDGLRLTKVLSSQPFYYVQHVHQLLQVHLP